MAQAAEQAKLRQGLKLEVDGKIIDHIRSVTGGSIKIPQVDVTTSVSAQQSFSTGRAEYEPLTFTFSNAKSNLWLIDKVCKYFQSPQTEKRSTIALTEIKRDDQPGAAITLYECFCTNLILPEANNQERVLETTMTWSIHRIETTAGGIA